MTIHRPPSATTFKRVIVPVSNPDTARRLLHLARAMVDLDDGKIMAVYVNGGNGGDEDSPSKTLQKIVKHLREDQGWKIEYLEHPAPGIARGVLDFTREMAGDLIILGVRNHQQSEIEMGDLARGIASAAPCDVIILASPRDAHFTRIVVPVDGSEHAQAACRMALQAAPGLDINVIEALNIRRPEHSQSEGRAAIEKSLEGLQAEDVRRVTVTASDPVSGLLERLTRDDLVIIGFASHEVMRKWTFGSYSDRLLKGLPGGLLITTALAEDHRSVRARVVRRLNWGFPTLTEIEQDELIWQATEGVRTDINYVVLASVAALIAAGGLLLNSGPVIIGSMLVAPLVTPLIAFSVGITTGRLPVLRDALPTLLVGVFLAISLSFLVGTLSGVTDATNEMLARSQPTLLDGVIALAGGVIAAFATARRDVSTALAGVAIAAALLPPVCTVGLGIALEDWNLTSGAALLFVTNIVCITLAGWAVFFWLGMRPRIIRRSRRRLYVSMAAILVMLLPLIVVLLNAAGRETTAGRITELLRDAFEDARLVETNITEVNEGGYYVIAEYFAAQPITDPEVLREQERVSNEIGAPVRLEVVAMDWIIPQTAPPPEETPPLIDN